MVVRKLSTVSKFLWSSNKIFINTRYTSVPSERMFSTTGIIVNKLRRRLSSFVIDQIVFLKKNGNERTDYNESDTETLLSKITCLRYLMHSFITCVVLKLNRDKTKL